MKRNLTLFLLFLCHSAFAQVTGPTYNTTSDYKVWGKGSFGKGDNTPTDPSAILELGKPGTDKGLLLPRITDTAAVVGPKAGLLVYVPADEALAYFDGFRWQYVTKGAGIISVSRGNDTLYFELANGITVPVKMDYYTTEQLQTPGQASVHWSNVDNITDAEANGEVKGIATFRSDHFDDDGLGAISLDTVNGPYYTKTQAVGLFIPLSQKGAANGVASLDAAGKVPLSQINDALLGAVIYQGTYNASTNTPALPTAGSGNKGWYYVVSVAGTQQSLALNPGDWVISNGSSWGKVDNNNAVTSVFGRTGAVTAQSGDYTTTQVTEGSNLYFTNTRARSALSAGTGISYSSGTGVISSTITQYTDALARAALSATSPLTYNSTTGVFGISDAVADGSTKGAATFSGNDFNSTSGVVSIDYTNGQSATGSVKGFLSPTDWTAFNNKGSVSSVALSLPSLFSVTGSPVTTTGTLTATLASQTANTVFSAPNGSAGAPTFRLLAAADIPTLTASKISDFTSTVQSIGDPRYILATPAATQTALVDIGSTGTAGVQVRNTSATSGGSSGGFVRVMSNGLPTGANQRLGGYIMGTYTAFGTTQVGAQIDAYSDGAWTAGSDQPTYLSFRTTADNSGTLTERMRLKSDGELALGITDAFTSIHTKMPIAGLTATNTNAYGPLSSGGFIYLLNVGTPSAADQKIGAIAMGSAPTDVNPRPSISIEGYTTGAWTDNVSHPANLLFKTTATGENVPSERLRIDASGNVGIGVSSAPASLLEVNGVITAPTVTAPSGSDLVTQAPAGQRVVSAIGSTTAMAINSDASIDIGVPSSPFGTIKLNVGGNVQCNDAFIISGGGSNAEFGLNGSSVFLRTVTASGLELRTSDVNRLVISATGTATFSGNTVFGSNGTPGSGKIPVGTDAAGNWTWQTQGTGAVFRSITAIQTGAYTVGSSDYTVLVNPSSSGLTLTIPTAASSSGRVLVLRNLHASNSMNLSQTVVGYGGNFTLLPNATSYMIQSNGTSWYQITN